MAYAVERYIARSAGGRSHVGESLSGKLNNLLPFTDPPDADANDQRESQRDEEKRHLGTDGHVPLRLRNKQRTSELRPHCAMRKGSPPPVKEDPRAAEPLMCTLEAFSMQTTQ